MKSQYGILRLANSEVTGEDLQIDAGTGGFSMGDSYEIIRSSSSDQTPHLPQSEQAT